MDIVALVGEGSRNRYGQRSTDNRLHQHGSGRAEIINVQSRKVADVHRLVFADCGCASKMDIGGPIAHGCVVVFVGGVGCGGGEMRNVSNACIIKILRHHNLS